jgi:hypothetical protein
MCQIKTGTKDRLTPAVERVLREVMGDDFDREKAAKTLSDSFAAGEVNVIVNALPTYLDPEDIGPCC